MGESYKERVEQTQAVRGVNVLAPFRAGMRLGIVSVWILGCFFASLCVSPVALVSKTTWQRIRKAISRTWVKGMSRVIGTRITVHGAPPKAPFFLVGNHLSWVDFFVGYSLLDGVGIVEEPVSQAPIVGALVKGFNPIFVRRIKEDTPRVNDLMVKAIEEGHSVIIAPETPITTIPPGSGVRQFRGGLLESAVRTGTPVHYLSLTYRTPEGYPPPAKAMLFGPNPYYRTPEGKIPESELKAWGPERSFLWHVLGLLALPWHEVIVTFGPEPIAAGSDRIALANQLHQAVERMFTPIA